jgi:hypothetical protein
MSENQISFKVSIVIPAFDEQGNVPAICQRPQDLLSPYPDHEILFVDDGSRDEMLSAPVQARRRVRTCGDDGWFWTATWTAGRKPLNSGQNGISCRWGAA